MKPAKTCKEIINSGNYDYKGYKEVKERMRTKKTCKNCKHTGRIKKIINDLFVLSKAIHMYDLIGWCVLLTLFLTPFIQVQWWTVFVALALYFVYKEVVEDIKDNVAKTLHNR